MTGPPGRRSKGTKQQSIVAGLSPREREALYRFYTLRQDISKISRDLGFDESELRALKSRVKKEFLAAGWSQ